MRISDWSSDVCSSDLFDRPRCVRLFIAPADPSTPGNEQSDASRAVEVPRLSASLRGPRSEERRGGKECVSTCRSRRSLYHSNIQKRRTPLLFLTFFCNLVYCPSTFISNFLNSN